MKNDQSKSEFILAAALVVMGIATRLLFHAFAISNFNAVMASTVFAGAYLAQKKWAIAIPIVTMFLTDLVIGFYDPAYMAIVYGAFILAFVIGRFYAKKPSFLRYIIVTLGGSLSFFLITNFAWWPFYTTLYPHTISGLIESYTLGLPFYKYSLLSDMLFSAALFGGFEMAKVYLPQTKKEVLTSF